MAREDRKYYSAAAACGARSVRKCLLKRVAFRVASGSSLGEHPHPKRDLRDGAGDADFLHDTCEILQSAFMCRTALAQIGQFGNFDG